ncbi:mechanosensitive ion channel family protein [Sphingomonas sp. IC4-52]|uniref:mechanosensitive ion channel family protein n=1 Tax=Sphingomonas sp. IC4-52 TaxID=2887202 RepID=UPI001D118195|nr:mechanosensitive ion channel family protein [Sphingomonas sp. IC4-52]MCC2979816.1 mechanosensitive ion channel family protein [Sphingomonas sp. IC4-52]
MLSYLRRFLLILLLATMTGIPALAQDAPANSTAPTIPADPFGRETPRSTVSGLIEALAKRDYNRAANYFDLPVQDDARVMDGASELARRLQVLLDSGGTLLPFARLSNEPAGRIDDDLPLDRELAGDLKGSTGDAPILLTHGSLNGRSVWRISHDTIRQLMAVPATKVAAPTTDAVVGIDVAGAPAEDWALLIGIAALSFVILRLIAAAALAVMRRGITDPDANAVYRFFHAALPPLSLFIAVMAFYTWAERLQVAIVARQTLLRYAGGVAAIALVWFGLRLVDAVADVAIARMHRRSRRQAVSVVTLLRRAAKILLLVFSIVAVLDTFGIDVTTGIAALGIGGIALALGAQKTVENLVGSVTVIADRPVQVGDFCRVGDVVGTVEDVGIRSTRIRTNDRTIVTIPNGDFSSRQIENFAKRDRFLFAPKIYIEYTTPDKIREAVAIIEDVLLSNENISKDGPRARFNNFGESALEIEVFSYIALSDFGESTTVRQDLLLSIYERLSAAGITIAVPTRTLFLAPKPPIADQDGPMAHSSAPPENS